MTDLLASLLADAAEGDLLVPNGATRGGWHVYASPRGGSWVADQLTSPQVDHTLHLRTADDDGRPGTLPTWHRSYHLTHLARPTVHCSFRIDRHDTSRDILGFKLAYLHQGNNHSAAIGPDVTFTDYTVASGVDYGYRVRAYGDNSTSTFSAWTT